MKVGNKAPAFTLPDKDGVKYSLKDIKADFTLIYFYPKDNTPGCTIEAVGFTKNLNKFKKLNTEIIGISGGDEKSKTKFCDKHKLKLTLLSDTDFKVSEKYGVYGKKKFMGRVFKGIKRMSFLLDSNKKIIKIYENVKPATHPDEVLSFIKDLGGK